MTVAYVPASAAALGPAVMPQSCVHASKGDAACELVVHHVRARKTGPQIPVTVMHCRTHRRAFTLYPLGHIPYGRVAVAPVGLDGEVVFSMEREPRADGKRSPAWRATRFGPAFAAIHDPTVKLTDPRWWATETEERLAPSAALLGVHPALSVPSRSVSRSRGSCSGRRPTNTRALAAGPIVAACWSACWTSSARTRACSIACWRPARVRGAGGP